MTANLPLQSDVRVWREGSGWKGPYKLLSVDGETCTLDMPHGPTKFRSTVVKPYYTEDTIEQEQKELVEDNTKGPVISQRRGRGRPLGSRNKPKPAATRQSVRKNASPAFITNKEQADKELSIKLRQEGVITTPGLPFEQSQTKEIEGLIAKGVFDFV
jgi:hypothetical protein